MPFYAKMHHDRKYLFDKTTLFNPTVTDFIESIIPPACCVDEEIVAV
ncbi:MAG: hypothetical protein IPL09_12910 [Bacteroidetes bacterium]|nr:hypothetical protein [Bacteroidota bacterium]